METPNCGYVVLFLALTCACSGSGSGIPTLPTSSLMPTRQLMTGQVTDATSSAPVSGAIVQLDGWPVAITDASGNYTSASWGVMTYVEADNYARDYRYVRGAPHDVHLHRIKRITAGDSAHVTIAPDDTLCVNNMQDSPEMGPLYVCRSVHVVAPGAGVMTLEALSTTNGPPPLLEVEIIAGGSGPCCSARLQNPTSIMVTAGTEVVANVEMPFGSTSSQSFTLKTSMRPP